ncbi:hypothetical protein REPUB_Repub16aG0133800 [Reevesia pubescens]
MASEQDMSSWTDLLHSSSKLLDQAASSAQFPPLQRNLDQLEALLKKLKAKTLRTEAPSPSIAATRLLAREGINAEQLTRDLKSFELKTTFEDVFPAEATSVEEYLQQVHEMAMVSAIQEAQKDNLRSFNDYMMKVLESIEIQKRIGAFSMALDTINKCLSEAICALSRGRLDGESRTAGLIHSGNEILETFKYYPDVRKDISKARWIDNLAMAEVVEKKGNMWVTMGIVRNGNTYCSIEETLFLIEIGALHLLDEKGICLSLNEVYEKLSDVNSGCYWELFEVYRHLKSLGYVVGRHGIPWSVKGQKIKAGTCSLQGSQERNELLEMESKDKNSIIELFDNMQITEVSLAFDVYLPNSKFRKSSPGDPSFVLYLSRGSPPSRVEIDALERKHGSIPLKFCQVENERVSIFSFGKVELAVLP